MTDWIEHAIWWQVFPLGFVGAELEALPEGAPAEHRLPRLIGWLDYLIDLGASGLALGPVFASQAHGYETTDYYSIDTRLGTEQDLLRVIDEAHERGIKVMLDGVFNHVGDQFPRFQQALAGDETSRRWFHLYPQDDGRVEYEHFEGHRQLVTLNHFEQLVVDFVVDVMCHWLDRGIDGWRLDAAYSVPIEFWSKVLPQVHARHPHAYIVGEVIHGDYVSFVREGGMDAVTQYELWKAIWSSMNDANFHELAWSLQRHDEFLDVFSPLTFISNHDVTRIASRLQDERHVGHALAILMTVGGTPSIYYGDEQAFRGLKEERYGGDDEIRPEFPDSPGELAAFGWPTYRLHQEIIGVRRRHPWLHRARVHTDNKSDQCLVYTASAEGHWLKTALSVSDAPVTLAVPGATKLLAGDATLNGEAVELPAHGWAIVE
ncbi:MAG: alpha-amylase family protein [Candidatus Nanopelagicales bacterium]